MILTILAYSLFSIQGAAGAQSPRNLALAATASASEDFGPALIAGFANDGDPATRWSGISGHNEGVWFQLDWPEAVEIGQVAILQYDTYVKEFDLQVWDDAKNDWKTLRHFGNNNSKLPLAVTATPAPVKSKRLRIGNITNGPSFTEVEVYEKPLGPETFLGSDLNGNIIGMVCDHWGREPAAGARVALSASCVNEPWTAAAVSDARGLFFVRMPFDINGKITIKTEAGGLASEKSWPFENLQYGLTPPAVGRELFVLHDAWKFSIDPPDGFEQPEFDDEEWYNSDAQGHWEMEGHRSVHGLGGYRRHFEPPGVAGRIKLRFDGVYSSAEVFVNGRIVARHDGGALPFEVDITNAVSGGDNVLALRVAEHSVVSDQLDHMSLYADVPLAGIMRKVTIFRVPDAHIGFVHVTTALDSEYKNATIDADVSIINESAAPAAGTLRATVYGPSGDLIASGEEKVDVKDFARADRTVHVNVPSPALWNAELPKLYNLTIEFDGETVGQRIGFRRVEVKGSQILLNGSPIKVRGTCHHDSDPMLGRAVTPEIEETDLDLMKEANLNSIRTSHYPPIPEMLDLADRIGIYVEDEGSFCWTGATNDLRLTPRVMQMNCELVERDRNHPSVLYWSICNESDIGYGLWRSREWIQKNEPSRPTTGTYHRDGDLDIALRHNPITIGEIDAIEKNVKNPVVWDESWCIWQDIWEDSEEIWIDPGIRDYYITKLPAIYDRFIHSPVVQGTEIWAWSDDIFLLPNAGLEYGRGDTRGHHEYEAYKMEGRGMTGDAQWGVVDGWRRRKPEFWHTKKLHSPVKIAEGPIPAPSGKTITINAENQYDFLDLSNLTILWSTGAAKGEAKGLGAPHARGTIQIQFETAPGQGDDLSLEIYDPQARLVDHYKFPIGEAAPHAAPFGEAESGKLEVYQTQQLNGNSTNIKGAQFELGFNETFGNLRRGAGFGAALLRSMPMLHLSPTGNPRNPLPAPSTWQLTNFNVSRDGDNVRVKVDGNYTNFRGGYEYIISPDARVAAKASFVYEGDDVWVRESGMRFEVPRDSDLLMWDRNAEYSVYPDDHIGRASGEARALEQHPSPGLPPDWSWSRDNSPLGCNDFRSTKRNIYWGWIGAEGGPGVLVESDGKQHLRACVDEDRIAVYVNGFYDGIGSRGEWTANYGRGRLLKKGERVEASASLRFTRARD
ncbi:MAG: discoidin domain-containing protein [Planctomycetes bacterium]|nr:discoidin domain-containing protein [Planctomycetota bacterium]